MKIKDNKELLLIIIGVILSISQHGIFIGIPLIIIGTYLLNKKVDKTRQKIENELENEKQDLIKLEKELENKKQDLIKLENKQKKIWLEKKEEMKNIDKIMNKFKEDARKEIENKLEIKLENKKQDLINLENEIETKEKMLIETEEKILLESVGFQNPSYRCMDSESIKIKIKEVREKQKQMFKDKKATTRGNWIIDGSVRKGEILINSMRKQIIRSFNNECEVIINKVKTSNTSLARNKIRKTFDSLNKLYEKNKVQISTSYLNLKFDELELVHDYNLKKEEEKEELRKAREIEKEEKKIQKQLAKEKEKYNKQNDKIKKSINKLSNQLNTVVDEEKEKLKQEIEALKQQIKDNNKEITKIQEYKERPKAGYVYIISNIGSFGENVYKIGVTRRDEPIGRIKELSGASVPFKYDIHALIFNKDAFALEKELHDKFDKNRINKVNRRKEFFNITIEDVKEIVDKNQSNTYHFKEIAEAQEYKQSLKMSE